MDTVRISNRAVIISLIRGSHESYRQSIDAAFVFSLAPSPVSGRYGVSENAVFES